MIAAAGLRCDGRLPTLLQNGGALSEVGMNTVAYWLIIFVGIWIAWLLIVQPVLSRLTIAKWEKRRGRF